MSKFKNLDTPEIMQVLGLRRFDHCADVCCDGESGRCHSEMLGSDDGEYVDYDSLVRRLTRLIDNHELIISHRSST